ncbi:hypothetical protein LUZ63_008354 [Rhynchospora breviuscula]|uniref:DUF506 family protein n=1 Tax=Rhynchospora breviuscula TaxID=2022672 RepID=A0A9Q0CTG7_9POAL|nr:hypothetical protein LUZ63_008354 [Rhynchospora breviuscula]
MGLMHKSIPAFDETARARLWGPFLGEHFTSTSSDDLDELADLVDSFYESDGGELKEELSEVGSNDLRETDGGDLIETLDELQREIGDETEVSRMRVEVEKAICAIGSAVEDRFFKERVVGRLRKKGFDAGLCKSSWEKSDGPPAGSYEYIDIISQGKTRYIIETNLPSNFEIARPSKDYTRIFQCLPDIFVGRPENLKLIVRVMSTAAVESIKSAGMHVPPWRRREYVLAKWFSSYKRSGNFGSVKMEKRGTNVNCRMAIGERNNRISRGNNQGNVV